MPAVMNLVRVTFGLEPRFTIDPDEAVALGAAIQAGMMDGQIEGLDVFSPFQAAFLRYLALKQQKEDQEGPDQESRE